MARTFHRLAALAAAAIASTARGDGFSARVEPGYLTSTTRNTAEGVTTETESAQVIQRYGILGDVAPWPLLRLNVGGLLDWTNGTLTSPAGTTDVDNKRWTGFGRLELGGPMARAGAGYDRREDWGRAEAADAVVTSRLIHETLSAYGVLRPEGLPVVDLRATRSHDYDVDRVAADRYQESLSLAMRYEPAPPVELRYTLAISRPRDEIARTETRSTSHFGRVTYQANTLEKRLSLFTSYELSRIDATTRARGPEGTVRTQQFPVRGLSGIETFPLVPERITLEANPALLDGNLTATAGLDIGYRSATTPAIPPRELGVQFADTVTPVNEVHVWVDRRVPQDIARLFVWSAWRSNDNVTWERVDPVGTARFDPFETRFEVPIPLTSARYLKLVVAPLAPNVTTDPQLATVLVTEVQTFLIERAADRQGTSSSMRGSFNGSARYRFDRVQGLAYDVSTFLRHGTGVQRVAWSVTNALSYGRSLGKSSALTARVDRSDLDDGRGHESANGYAVSLSTAPLPTLSASLAVNGSYQQTTLATDWRHAVVAATSADLYTGISVGANGSLTYGESNVGRATRAADGRATATLVPHRTFNLSAALAASEVHASGGGQARSTDSSGRVEAGASFTPVPALLFSGTHTRHLWGELSPESLSSFSANASPFAGGALLLRFTFSESVDTAQELRTRSWGPGLRWTIRPRWFLDVTYTRSVSRTPALETQTDTFLANLLGIIG